VGVGTIQNVPPPGLQGLSWAVGTALNTWWNHKDSFRELQRRGMQRDSSWETAAQQYEQIMAWATADLPYCQ
jgi:starch synthase